MSTTEPMTRSNVNKNKDTVPDKINNLSFINRRNLLKNSWAVKIQESSLASGDTALFHKY